MLKLFYVFGRVLPLLICSNLFYVVTTQAEESTNSPGAEAGRNGSVNSASEVLKQQKDQLLGLLAQVDERYGDAAATLRSIQSQIEQSHKSLDKLRLEIISYQHQIDALDEELSGQVRAAYAMGQQDKLKLILNQQDPALSGRMMVYYGYINKAKLEKLKNLQGFVNYLDQLDKERQTESELLEKNLIRIKAERVTLDQVKKEQQILIEKLNSNLTSEVEQLSFLKESESKLINLIGTLENEPDAENQDELATNSKEIKSTDNVNFPKLTGDFSTLKGKLPLPVKGKISNMFDVPSSEAIWKGVLISAQEGAEIRSVTKGKVVYSGTLKGYGLMVIVEHDGGFMSLYAFNQSLIKHKGDSVEPGDVIATVGQSGGRTQPGLYFEIRQQGKPVDPLVWCRN